MTRKQAIRRVLQFLEESPELDENLCKAKYKLQEMLNGIPGKLWDDNAIRAAIERFLQENGRPPKVKELDIVEYLPSHSSVYQQYKITAGKWIGENYPFCGSTPDADAFRQAFRQEYNRILPTGGQDYNRRRTQGSPTWQTVAKAQSIRTWSHLVASCAGALAARGRKGEHTFCVSSRIMGLEKEKRE